MYEAGVAYVPADRHRFGLVLSFPVADNLVLTPLPPTRRSRGGSVRNDAAIDATAKERIAAVRHPDAVGRRPRPATLSGGNQQKVVVAREFDRDLRLLVLDQPTRGLDVGSIEFIHRQAIAKRDAGTAILLVSAELDEVLELSDRIVVMYRGEHRRRSWTDATADKNEIGLLMATAAGRRGAKPPRADG